MSAKCVLTDTFKQGKNTSNLTTMLFHFLNCSSSLSMKHLVLILVFSLKFEENSLSGDKKDESMCR